MTRRLRPCVRGMVALTMALLPVLFAPQRPAAGTGLSHARLASPAAEAAPDLRFRAQFGGDFSGLAATDDGRERRLFVGIGAHVAVYGITDTQSPRWLGESAPLPATVTHLVVEGGHLYATLQEGSFLVFDITGLPEIVGTLPAAAPTALGLHMADGIAYLPTRNLGLRIIDAREASSPRLLAKHAFPSAADPSRPLDVETFALRGSTLAILATDPAIHEGPSRLLLLLDLADPTRAIELGRLAFEAPQPRSLSWQGEHLYIGAYFIHVVDVADLRSPRLLATLPKPDEDLQLGSLSGSGDHLYQGALRRKTDTPALLTYDLSDPALPHLKTIHEGVSLWRLLLDGTLMVSLNAGSGRITLYAMDREQGPLERSSLQTPGSVSDIAAEGGRLLVKGRTALWTLALGDVPRLLGRADVPWSASRMLLHRGRLIVAARDSLLLVDAADPEAPRTLASLPIDTVGQAVLNLAIQGDLAYALIRRSRAPTDLWIVDLRPEAGLPRLGAMQMDLGWNDMPQMTVAGSTLLISSDKASNARELVAIDVADPTTPREAWRHSLPEHVWSLATGAGSTVYAGTDRAILTLDVEAPDRRVEVSRLEMGSSDLTRAVRGLAYTGDRLYAYLAPPTGPEDPEEIVRSNIGSPATLRAIDILPEGSLRPRSDLVLAANFSSGAAYSPVVDGALVAFSGGTVGVMIARRASGRGAFADLLLPWADNR